VKNFIKEKLLLKKSVCGVWSIIPSPIVTEIVALSGMDFQIFDLEHGAHDFTSIENSIRISENLGCSPLVRIGSLDPFTTQKILDFGAHGIIYPQVKDMEDVSLAMGFTKYPPAGTRGYNPFTRVENYSIRGTSKARNTNAFSINGVIIENRTAALDLDRILDVEDLEIVYLGAYDMSVALGKPGDMKNPELVKFMELSIDKILKAKKIAGVMAQSVESIKHYRELGACFIVTGVDSFLIGNKFSTLKDDFLKNS
jgi:4-hydroxy-2-oxoheptanedioate aldolase